MGQVDGKVALVTGGGSGIGAACARTLAREGARVAVCDVDAATAETVAREIAAAGGKAIALQQDVTDEARWPLVVAEIEKRLGAVSVVVANAGIALRRPLLDMTLVDWRRQQAINLDGVFLSVKHTVPSMRRAGGGSIIMMSSVAGIRGSPGLAAYSATKGGVRLFAKAVAAELAMTGDNIRCNSVHPGIIETAIWGKMDARADGPITNNPIDYSAIVKQTVPVGRAGQAEDIANGVLFLASDASSYMTGAEIVIDGGLTGGTVRRT